MRPFAQGDSKRRSPKVQIDGLRPRHGLVAWRDWLGNQKATEVSALPPVGSKFSLSASGLISRPAMLSENVKFEDLNLSKATFSAQTRTKGRCSWSSGSGTKTRWLAVLAIL